MSDGTTPGAPPGTPSNLTTQVMIATAIVHLRNRLHGSSGPPRPAPFFEPKQQRRPGQARRDHKGRFVPRG